MKKIAILLLFLLSVSKISAQGISFEHGTFKEALAKAKAENKLLFMDCYTTWCGPCKVMSRDVFPQKEVGDYINAGFISIKIDMEKGEGIDLAATYNVKAFPTLLFFNSEGKVLHSLVGSANAEDFIKEAKIAYNPSEQLDYLEKQFESGNRDLALVSRYLRVLTNAKKPDQAASVGKTVIPLMKTSQYLTEEGFIILTYAGIEYKGKEYKYILNNKNAFVAKSYIGQKGFDNLILNAIKGYLYGVAIKAKSLEELKRVLAEVHKDYVLPQPEQMDNYFINKYYLQNKQYDDWFDFNKKLADAKFSINKKDALPMYINTAYTVAVNPDFEKAGLYEKAVSMIENFRVADPESLAVNYCLASLYLKTGDKTKALENVNAYIKKTSDEGTEPDKRTLALKSKIENL
jgi:thioredoxin-related protein